MNTRKDWPEAPWSGIKIGEEVSGSEILMRALYQENVKTIFGYPGGIQKGCSHREHVIPGGL